MNYESEIFHKYTKCQNANTQMRSTKVQSEANQRLIYSFLILNPYL